MIPHPQILPSSEILTTPMADNLALVSREEKRVLMAVLINRASLYVSNSDTVIKHNKLWLTQM